MVTKKGQEFIKQASIGGWVTRGLGKLTPEKMKKPFEWSYKALKGPTDLAARGMGWAGRQMVERPGTAIPTAGVGLYGAHRLQDEVQKNYLHTDPQMNVTRREGLGERFTRVPSIQYVDPNIEKYFQQRNLIY